MDIGRAIYKILHDNIAVESMVGTRIAPNVMKQTSPFPFIIYDVATDTPEGQKDSVALLDTASIMVSAYCKTYSDASKLANYIRTALDRVNGVYYAVNIQSIDFDGYDDVFDDMSGSDGIYRKSLNFNVRIINSFNNIYSTHFDGVDDTVSLGVTGMDAIKNTGSISIWFSKDDDFPNEDLMYILVDSNNIIRMHYLWRAADPNEIRIIYTVGGVSVSAGTTNGVAEDGLWHHIVGTWDKDGDIKFYLDGVLKDTDAMGGAITGSFTAAAIGSMTTGANCFQGNLDEVSLFDKELTATEVSSLYNDGFPFNPKPLDNMIGYWRMGDGGIVGDPIATFPTIPDVTGNNDGTMTNMTSSDFEADVPNG